MSPSLHLQICHRLLVSNIYTSLGVTYRDSSASGSIVPFVAPPSSASLSDVAIQLASVDMAPPGHAHDHYTMPENVTRKNLHVTQTYCTRYFIQELYITY